MTISEAAALLGVHPNTVRKRIKADFYEAEKVLTENGPTWLISRESLANTSSNTPIIRASQTQVNPVVGQELQGVLTDLVKAIEKDPERENRLEAVKLRVRALQAQAAISSALIIGFGAIVSFLPDNPQGIFWVYGAFGMLLASVVFAFIYMNHLASSIAVNIERPRSKAARAQESLYYISSLGGFAGGVAMFLWFLGENTS